MSTDPSESSRQDSKRIAFVECSSDLWLATSQTLGASGVQVVFWSGRKEFFNLQSELPDECTFMTSGEARMGEQISSDTGRLGLPEDCEEIWRESRKRVFSQMDRLDHYSRDMTSGDKELLLVQYFYLALSILEELRPSLVVFAVPPHAGYDFVLFLLCRSRQVKTLVFDSVSIAPPFFEFEPDDRQTPLSIPGVDLQIWRTLESEDARETKLDDCDIDLFDRFRYVPSAAVPVSERVVRVPGRQPFLPIASLTSIKGIVSKLRMGKGVGNTDSLYKERGRPLGDSYQGWSGGLRLLVDRVKYRLESAKLRRYYSSICTDDFAAHESMYVYFPLSVQPERTTNPIAGDFESFLLTVSRVAFELRDRFIVVLREHPSMIHPSKEALMYRSEGFYRELSRIRNVVVVPVDYDHYKLIDSAEAVFTLGGTSALEAISRSVPAFVFSNIWFASAPGVVRIDPDHKLEGLLNKLENAERPRPEELANYFQKVRSKSIPVFTDEPFGSYDFSQEKPQDLHRCIMDYLQ